MTITYQGLARLVVKNGVMLGDVDAQRVQRKQARERGQPLMRADHVRAGDVPVGDVRADEASAS